MHRVDTDGYTTVGGERRFINRSMPAEEGTIDGAYWNNAVQEEIVTVIEHAGLTLRASGAADETAGWDQLKTAIFDSAAITGAAITNASIGLAKLTSGTSPSLVDSSFLMANAGGTKATVFDEEGAQITVSSGSTYIKGNGLFHYITGLGSGGGGSSIIVRDSVIKIDASGWTWGAVGSDFTANPSYELGKVASSAIADGDYGAYTISIVGYSSVISAQVGQVVSKHFVSYDGSGNATLDTVYTATDPSAYAGLRCYIRLHRVDV